MLGLGGRDDFLTQEGESARGATETRTATVASGAELPLGFTRHGLLLADPDRSLPAGRRRFLRDH